MQRGTLGTLVNCLSAAVAELPVRAAHSARKYSNRVAGSGAFAVFFFQFSSFLRYMREMEDTEKRGNVQSLFAVEDRKRTSQCTEEPGGYNLEHNFGHGSNHAADIFFLLNLLAL